MIEDCPRARRLSWWFGLVVVWVFALAFLLFGLIDALAVPADQRVNNGRQATFFAVHINPYYEFSEDFHLYVVRAKRIAERGWTDSPLYSHDGEAASYTAPLQVLLMRLAVLTDGRPWPYACFIVGVTGIAWTILYLSAARWMPPSVSPLAVPIGVMFTVLFESPHLLIHANTEYGQWPMQFGLRMSTMAWSRPLALSLLIAATSLLLKPERAMGRLAFIAVLLAAFAASDVWTFVLCGACLTVALGILGVRTLRSWRLRRPCVASWAKAAGGLAAICTLGLGVYAATNQRLTGDVLLRAGFGEPWKGSEHGVEWGPCMMEYSLWAAQIAVAVGLLSVLYVRVDASAGWRTLSAQMNLAAPNERRRHLMALALVPIGGLLFATGVLATLGMEEYLICEFLWRVEFIMLFAFMITIIEFAKRCIRFLCERYGATSFRWEVVGAIVLLFGLWSYHVARTYGFVDRMAAREFFLTEDEERLRDWLKKREESSPGRRDLLATTSHELNYLCAYWTDADLLLPEGFPYHSRESDEAIEQRTAHLLAVYNTTPERWLEFNLHRHGYDQWNWAASRLLSARQGYMYYLMHRAIGMSGNLAEKYQSYAPRRTTARLADQRLQDEYFYLSGQYRTYRAGFEAAHRIARHLEEIRATSAPLKRPDVVIVDESSRFLGTPDQGDYARAFVHGTLEAWVRKGAPREGEIRTAAKPSAKSTLRNAATSP